MMSKADLSCCSVKVEAECALRQGEVDHLDRLIRANPSLLDIRDTLGHTLLHQASIRGDHHMIRLLVSHSMDVNLADRCGTTPLMLAVTTGHLAAIHQLVTSGGQLAVVDVRGRGAVMYAACSGSVHALLYLTNVCGLSVDVMDRDDVRPLHLACESGHLEMVQFLLTKSAFKVQSCDANGNCALHFAMETCNAQIVWLLLLHGGFRMLHMRNGDGLTPLDLAIKKRKEKLHQPLLEQMQMYMKEPKTSKPKTLWRIRLSGLVMPLLYYIIGICLVSYLSPTQPSIGTTFTVVMVMFKALKTGSRVKHMSQIANTMHSGLYLAGNAILVFTFIFSIQGKLDQIFVNSMLVTWGLYVLLLVRLLLSDPGILRSTRRDSASILDALYDHARFCSRCELVQPEMTKHCSICNACVQDCDHHNTIFMICIGRNNRWSYVMLTFSTLVCLCIYMACLILYIINIDRHAVANGFLGALYRVASADAVILGGLYFVLVGMITSLYNFLHQIFLIGNGQTMTFNHTFHVKKFTASEHLYNVYTFLISGALVQHKGGRTMTSI